MLKKGFKLEVEALIGKDISYVKEEYALARLKEKRRSRLAGGYFAATSTNVR